MMLLVALGLWGLLSASPVAAQLSARQVMGEEQCAALCLLYQTVKLINDNGVLNLVSDILHADSTHPSFDCFQNIFADPCETAYQFMLCYNNNPDQQDGSQPGSSNIFTTIFNYIASLFLNLVGIISAAISLLYHAVT